MTLVAFLQEIGILTAPVHIRAADVYNVAIVTVGPREHILIERTYRPGVVAIPDATADELAIARSEGADLHKLWNGRGDFVAGVI